MTAHCTHIDGAKGFIQLFGQESMQLLGKVKKYALLI